MNYEVVYKKHNNLKLAANELGIKWQTLYYNLKKLNVPVIGDKLKYGSDKDKLAARSELLFNKIVPNSVNQNLLSFQSKFDFLVNGQKVDIKASKLTQGSKRFKAKRWAFSVKKQEFTADFIICFGFYNDETFKILMIPGEMVRNYQTISISECGKSKWLQFEITEQDMCDFFFSYGI